MKQTAMRTIVVAVVVVLLSGCDVLTALLQPTTVIVRLVNEGDFDVEGTLFFDGQQDIPALLLTEIGDELDFTVRAGEASTFIESCDDLQAIVIEDADLLVLVGAGPDASSDVRRDGDDFSCGDTIVFTFDHSAVVLDFDVSFRLD